MRLLTVYFAALFIYFFLGMIWYSNFLFGKKWLLETGISKERMKATPVPIIRRNLIVTFLCCALVTGALMTLRIHMMGEFSWEWIRVILVLDGALVVCTQLPGCLFEKRSTDLFLINAGYHYLGVALVGILMLLI